MTGIPGTYSSMALSTGSSGIEFVGIGSFAVASGGTINPTLPAGSVNGDFLLCFHHVKNGQSLTTPSGWTGLGGYEALPGGSGTNYTKAAVYYRFSNGSGPSVTAPGDHNYAIVAAFRNVNTSNPFDNTTVNNTISSTAASAANLNTVTARSMLVNYFGGRAFDANGNKYSGFANTSLESITEAFDLSSTSGGGGSLVMTYGIKPLTGATANTTFTVSGSTILNLAHFSMALRPA